jgi:hypothetical protein
MALTPGIQKERAPSTRFAISFLVGGGASDRLPATDANRKR